MNKNQHLLYYWKDIDKNLKEGKVGWLGTKKPCKKLFSDFNNTLHASSNSWVVAFKWEKSTNKTLPLAILKATEHPVVQIVTDEPYENFIYYDPRQSFRLLQPTDPTRLANFHKLGSEIVSNFKKGAMASGFIGANGVHLISREEMEKLLENAEIFGKNELSIYVNSSSWLTSERSGFTRLSNDSNLLKAAQSSNVVTDSSSRLKPNSISETNKLDILIHQYQNTDDGVKLTEPDSIGSGDSQGPIVTGMSDDSPPLILGYAERQPLITDDNQASLEAQTQNLKTAEREAVVKVRYGQAVYREALLKEGGEKCWMSGIEGKRLLVASHIKPWSHCENDTDSRGCRDNGLLLSSLWDAAFDAGLIGFESDWSVVTSPDLSESAKTALGLNGPMVLPVEFRTDTRKEYLAYHFAVIFDGIENTELGIKEML